MIKFLRITVVFVACCAVLGIVVLISDRSKKVDETEVPQNSAPQELVFRNTAVFDGKTEDGVRFADCHYKSSDCVAISHTNMFFKSPARAHEEIERETRKASTIIERAPLVDDQGQAVGERVVLQSELSEQNKAPAQVIWNKNSNFHSIAAPSLKYVLEFEKALGSQSGRIASRIDTVQKITFAASEARDGRTEEGFSYSEKQFRSSDCETVIERIELLPSPAGARDEMQKMLKESTNIIERGPKLNASGQPVGERAVAMFKADLGAAHIEDTVVMWTVNSELHSIRGLFTHMLELEKRNYRDY